VLRATPQRSELPMSLNSSQEYPLEARPETPLWSENFALAITDPQNRVYALYCIGTWYHDTSVWRENLAVALPDGKIVVARHFGRNTAGPVVSASLSKYEITEVNKKVRLSYSGPVWTYSFQDLLRYGANAGKTKQLTLDVAFEATTPIWDMHAGHGKDPTGLAGAMHIEQLGRCDGTLRFDSHETLIRNAQSCRDHSRGSRDVTNYRNHCWINGTFSGGRSFHLYVFKMHYIEGTALSCATVVQDNVHYPATIEQIAYVDGPEDFGILHSFLLRSALGDMRIAVKEVLATIPESMTSPYNDIIGVVRDSHALLFEEPIRIECNGESGFGWCERGFSKQPLL